MQLAFDAVRERILRVGYQQEDATVSRLPFGPSPFDVQFVVAVLVFRIHISERIAGYLNHTILYRKNLFGRNSVLVNNKVPVRQILSVE